MNTLARLIVTGAALATLCPSLALAGGTKLRKLSTFADFSKGESKDAIISPDGKVLVGYADQSTDIPGTELVLSCNGQGSKVYAGTGMPGAVYEVKASKGAPSLKKLAQLPGVAVTAVAQDSQGRVLAAALPGSKIYLVKPGKEPKVFAEVPAGRIWDLRMHQGTLYAATGPEGRVFSVSRSGKTKLVLDTDAVDVLTLLSLPDALLAGTANNARVYQVTKKKEGQLLQAFDGKEVRALRSEGQYIYAAVNAFESRGLSGLRKMAQKVNETSVTGTAPMRDQLKSESRKASGTVFRMQLKGEAKAAKMAESVWEELFEKDDQYFTDLAPVEKGRAAMVTSSQEGKVYRVRGFEDATLVADFDQEQASAVCRSSTGSLMAFSAGPAVAHRLSFAQANQASYSSAPLDATLPAQYGVLRVRGQGKLSVQVRTGPSEEIDERWTSFRAVPLKPEGIYRVGPLKAKRMRYLQLQVKLGSKDARLDSAEFFYRPFNLAPSMGEIKIQPPKFDIESNEDPDLLQEIKWSADARDNDDLQFLLSIRENRKGAGWTPLNGGEPVTDESYELNIENLPDGVYQVSVQASDELNNGSAQAQTDRRVSEPFLVDKARPGFVSVKKTGQRITGTVKDRLSRIHDVSYKIDEQGYRVASPSDGIYDEKEEAFEIELPQKLAPGARVLIRVRDEHGNRRTTAVR